ncbi:MAG: OB-fold domain-containing protein [Pseudomonadota bacterium]
MSYLPEGMPIPQAESDGLSAPYWEGLRDEKILVQRCGVCQTWQWGPEWICHQCLGFELQWVEVRGMGRIYTWQRSHHPVHPALREAVPYITVLVELPDAGGIRMIGNLLGDSSQDVRVGAAVAAEFEHHTASEPGYTLLQWRYV